MGVLGTIMVLLSTQTAMAVPVLFIVFIIRAITKRRKMWIGISIAICAVLTTILFWGGCLFIGMDEDFQEEYGSAETTTSIETTSELLASEVTTSTAETTLKTTPEPPVIETTTAPPETTTPTTQATTTTTEPPETTTTEPPVTFEEIYIAYQGNELRASENYKGERVRISGTVDSVSESFWGTTTVWIVAYAQGDDHYLICTFDTKEQKDSLMKLNTGDYITFEGTCDSATWWLDCEIVE